MINLLANPDTPRAERFQAEARALGVELALWPWADVVARDGQLPDGRRAGVVRIESPGKDDGVAAALLLAGHRADPARFGRDAALQAYHFGEVRPPAQQHAGFAHVLAGVERALAARPELTPLVPPRALLPMFDKRETHQRLGAAGIPHPEGLTPPPDARALLAELAARDWQHAYVKLRTGSCAAGLVLVDVARRAGVATFVERGGRRYNTRLLERSEGPALERLLGFVLAEGAVVERAVPLAELDGQPFDARVVVLDGEPAFWVFRQAALPITNLHLGGRRADAARCLAALPRRLWLEALDDCARAARLFGARVVGVDVLFDRARMRHYLLELNAFGDFVPGLADARGRSIHRAVLEMTGLSS